MAQAREDIFGPPDEAKALIAEAKKGNREALGEVLNRCRPMLEQRAQKHLSGLLSVKVSAADLVSDAFVVAVEKFREFRGSTGKELWVWLDHTLTHLARDLVDHFLRTTKYDLTREQQLPRHIAERIPAPDEWERSDDEEEQIRWRAFWELDEDYQEVITLHLLKGMPLKEVAESMGRSLGAVTKLWQRGVRQWRDGVARLKGELKKPRRKKNPHGRP